jgi:DNA-binding NarL/FixJ family response regulator
MSLYAPIRVMIADDHIIYREGLKSLLLQDQETIIVGEAGNGKELIDAIKRVAPEVILMDILMPVMDGIETTRYLTLYHPAIRILGLSMWDDQQHILEMLKAGARGYVSKSAEPAEIVRGVQSVYQGGHYYCRQAVAILTDVITRRNAWGELTLTDAPFTEKERVIIQLICSGYSNKMMADELYLSKRTVEGHRLHIMKKMKAANTADVVVYAIRHGLYCSA